MLRLSRRVVLLAIATAALLSVAHANASDEICGTGTCLANGDTVCDRATEACPPCMYDISGGYSCYGAVGDACPYPDTLTICPPPTASTPTPTVTPSPVEDDTETPSAISSSTGSSTSSTASSSSTSGNTETPAPTEPIGTVAPANQTESSSTNASQNALTTETKTVANNSPGYVNVVIICGAAIGVLLVAVFIVRRVRQRRHEPPMDNMDFKTHKGFHHGPTTTRRGGNQSMYTSTQPLTDRIDFSTLEPVDARTKSRRDFDQPMRISDAPSSLESGARCASALEFTPSVPRRQIAPASHSSDRLDQFPTTTRARAKSRVRGMESSIIQNQFPELVGSYNSVSSIVSSEKSVDEYDIVDPGAIRPGERRNTETLVADGRFRQLSTASLAESYVSDATTESSEYSHSVYV